MSTFDRNERLAIRMGWKLKAPTVWITPTGEVVFGLPDFRSDNCAAVKWLLPFIEQGVWEWSIQRSGMENIKVLLAGEIPGMPGREIVVEGSSVSLALAAAMLALKGGDS